MSKKFFSLIHGEQIHIAPKAKILSEDATSTLLSAEEVLEKVQEDALQFKKEVVEEAEKEKQISIQEGFEEGFKAWVEQIVFLENEIKSVHEELQKLVIPVALKAAQKIVGAQIELSEKTIVDIVAACLKNVSQHKKVVIYVNRKDLEILEKSRQRLRDVFENVESLSLRDREDVKSGGCIIETEVGIVNAQIDQRWAILEQAFQQMLKKTGEKV